MENQDLSNNNYFSQLETIKAIENSLVQLKSRIEFMHKEEDRKSKQYDKILTSSIPIIKDKISQFNYISKVNSLQKQVKNLKEELHNQQISKIDQIKMSRFEKQNDLNRSKMEIYQSKAHDSLHIRQMSKKNSQIIKYAREQWVNQKKKKSQLVKMERKQSRRKIQQFYLQKEIQLKKQRNQQKRQLEKRIKNVGYMLSKMIKTEKAEQQNYKNQQKMLQKLKNIVSVMNGMKPQEFSQIISNLHVTNNTEFDDQAVQKILLEVCRRKCLIEQTQNKEISIIEKPDVAKRFNSQAESFVRIYGGTKSSFNKKLR